MTNYRERDGCHNCRCHYELKGDFHGTYCALGAPYHWLDDMKGFLNWIESDDHDAWAMSHQAEPQGTCDDYEGEQ